VQQSAASNTVESFAVGDSMTSLSSKHSVREQRLRGQRGPTLNNKQHNNMTCKITTMPHAPAQNNKVT
jgi:hypothetical protein